ncbi:MAG: hypothetical protein KDC49_05705 [Saprospiraceae bacterium]|nr:hypothetical protein [Saprospiraceae bacterium]
MKRDQDILALRPNIDLNSGNTIKPVEKFQNQCLRPILKIQHDLLVKRFSEDPQTLKSGFSHKNPLAMQTYISSRVKNDTRLQKEFIGMITGLMTVAEFDDYLLQKQEIDRRILTMLSARIIDGLVPKQEISVEL